MEDEDVKTEAPATSASQSRIRLPRRKLTRWFGKVMKWVSGSSDDDLLLHFFQSRPLTPENVIQGYVQGFFPIPDESGRTRWFDPEERAIIPVEDFHTSSREKRRIRQGKFTVTMDKDFSGVIRGCSNSPNRDESSWITPAIIETYTELHKMGVAHSIEVWQEEQLVAGTYGLTIGAYYVGESQFYTVDHMGKVATYYLCQSLKECGFLVHDVQYVNPGLANAGARAIPRAEFKSLLARALVKPVQLKLTSTLP
jgi:leucyl/phenylalanyl-tRNA--protein transferase